MDHNHTTTDSELETLPLANKVIEVFVLCAIILVSLFGNGSLWIVVLRSRALRTITSMFILGLSMADLLVALVNMPVTVYTIIVGQWTLSRDACVVTGYINMLTLSTSVLSLCNISINRYVMVCHPGRYKDIYTTRNSIFMVSGVVTLAAVVSMPPLFGWSEYVYTHTHSFCFADWANHMSYAFFMIGCCFCLPCTVMAICNFMIIRSVRISRLRIKTHRLKHGPTSSGYSSDTLRNVKVKQGGKKESFDLCSVTSFVRSNTPTPVDILSDIQDGVTSSFENSPYKVNVTMENIDSSNDIANNIICEVNNEYSIVSRNTVCQFSRASEPIDEDSNSALITDNRAEENDRDESKLKGLKSENFSENNNCTKNIQSNTKPIDINLLYPKWRSGFPEDNATSSTSVTAESKFESVPSRSIDNPNAGSDSTTEPQPYRRTRSTHHFRRREEIRLAFSLVVIVFIFVICWLPYCISMVLSIFYKGHIPREFHVFTLMIGYANSGCNPIVYGVMNKRFQVGFKRLICFWRKHELSISSSERKT